MNKCIKCGVSHGMGIEDMESREITPIEYCRDCLFGLPQEFETSPYLPNAQSAGKEAHVLLRNLYDKLIRN